MHYYQFHIGDYISHTRHLSLMEDLAYRRLLDFYFLHEQPIKHRDVARQIGMKEHEEDVLTVLNEFFLSTPEGFVNPRADKEIKQYKEFSAAGKRGAAKRWGTPPNGGDNSPPNATPIATNNHKPLTNNQGEATRISEDWFLSKTMGEWAVAERPDLDVRKQAEQFKDYWLSQPDDKAYRKDWFAVWRHWIRGCHVAKPNPADNIRLTVPASNEPDPALMKIKQDEKITRPPTPEERAILNAYRRKA